MPLRRSLLGSRSGSAREVAAAAGPSLTPEALTTGGLLLLGAGLALTGPLLAALLIRASGGGRADAAATVPLVLAVLAVIAAVTSGFTLFVTAWRRSRTPMPQRLRSRAALRAGLDGGGAP
ncbi:hypothetical protein [Nocardia veterana]|uniref:Uncharacterized protein n=1 Tax=Nocardia veterana TaxID=132249 RepID=A0A7X6LV65_9NOCA|nr:hypothetical protein [Nocardia veterana]NKY85194.1 hypothetical protein [Nocardia veterana]